jgi:hypothetical protein
VGQKETFANERGRQLRQPYFVGGVPALRRLEMAVAEFLLGLRQLGWTEGPAFHTDLRWAGGNVDRMQELAAELVALHPMPYSPVRALSSRQS